MKKKIEAGCCADEAEFLSLISHALSFASGKEKAHAKESDPFLSNHWIELHRILATAAVAIGDCRYDFVKKNYPMK